VNEAEKLGVSTSSSERSRRSKNEDYNLAADLPALQPGALMDHNIYAHNSRPRGRGLCNWRQYGNLPHACTHDIIDKDGNILRQKVFEWRGLFKDINGRETFVDGKNGAATIRLIEPM